MEDRSWTFDETKREWVDQYGARYSEDRKKLVSYRDNHEESFDIPNSITSIEDGAFMFCSRLWYINIPDSVTSIGNGAFMGCSSLRYINIQDSVTSIGDNAFMFCSRLEEINIPDPVTSIGDGAFGYCSRLWYINIPDSVTSIGNGAFMGCSRLEKINIQDSVTSIGDGAFFECPRIRKITIPNSVKEIGHEAFWGCPVKEVRLPHNTNYHSDSFDEVTKVVKAKVFISYSWDDEEHKAWVRKLAEDLQKNGVYVILDQWVLRAGKQYPHFIDKSIAEAERVILIMTPNYKKKSDNEEGGVGYEYSIIKDELFGNLSSDKMIPILRVGPKDKACPRDFKNRIYLDFRKNIPYGNSFNQLLREIYKVDYL